MDNILRSCFKCGHSLSVTAEACAYCGAVVSSAESPPLPDDIEPVTEAQTINPPPLQADDSPPVLDMADELAHAPQAADVKSAAGLSNQIQPEKTRPKVSEPAAQAGTGAQNPLSDADGQIEFQPPGEELIVELDTQELAKDPEQTSGADTVSAEIKAPESKPDTSSDLDDNVDLELHAAEAAAEVIPLADKVSAKAASDDSPGLPETPVLEESGEAPSESETLGADILELVEVEASEPESARGQASETATPSDEPDPEQKAEPGPDPTPDGSENQEGEPEAILLTSDDSSESGKAQAKAEVIRTQTEAQASVGALKIAKASQEVAEAQKKQKADIARAKALKMKKLKLAQAQALKQKKAAVLKARALKKQKEAQAGIEKANKEMPAGSNPQRVDTPDMIIQSMEANTKILGLLKKYQGQVIGINYGNSADIKEAELVEANDEFFSVFVKDQELNYSHPLKTILTIIEGKDGVGTGTPDQKTKFSAVIKVYPLVLF
jgi:hypothetical protein